MDAKQLVDSLKEVAQEKSLTVEAVIGALEAALTKAYIKVLGGGEDAVVTCSIDPDSGKIYLAQIKTVKDDVQDDYLEIETEEANAGLKKPQWKDGDQYPIEANVEDLSKATAMGVKNYLRQNLAEAERSELYRIYKDHIGEMVTGTVERADDHGVIVNIGRATVELTRKELIGDEYFKINDPIKVYIQEVRTPESDDPLKKKKGPQIEATRSSEGFLKRLFEEEIHEVYDGTVLIKAIARSAGTRAKVAVTSRNEDVDATGACIGAGGTRIQKIVAQLGNSRNKEKIDIINWSEYAPKFIMEAVRPVVALGAAVDEENKTAKVILSSDSFLSSATRYRANLGLASRLTGYKIEFVPMDKADALGIAYVTKAAADEEAKRVKAAREQEEYRRKTIEEAKKREEEVRARAAAAEAAKKAEEEARRAKEEEAEKAVAKPVSKAEPLPATPAVAPKAAVSPESFPTEAFNPAAAALAAMKAAKAAEREESKAEPVAAEAPKEEEKEVVEPTEVKTTTTLSALESELESAKKQPAAPKFGGKSNKRPRKITEEEVKRETPKIPEAQGIEITYTPEELKAIEEEENAAQYDEGDDVDYEDYDDYYGDEK